MDTVSTTPPTTEGEVLAKSGSGRFDPLELALMLGCLTWLLPNTWFSKPLESGFWLLFNNLGVSQVTAPTVFYVIGLVLLTCLIARCLYVRYVLQAFPPALVRFLGAVTLFACLYPLDFFFSTALPFDFRMCWWPFFVIAAFFIVVLYLNQTQSVRIVYTVAFVTGVQALCAIYFYIKGQHQYVTPHFGNRTDGTFASPNTLYPLCLLGGPLCGTRGSPKEPMDALLIPLVCYGQLTCAQLHLYAFRVAWYGRSNRLSFGSTTFGLGRPLMAARSRDHLAHLSPYSRSLRSDQR
jgi:hypothetical protein